MTITLRQESANGATTKGASLTFAELDNNFIHLLRQGSVTVRADSGTDQTLGEEDKDSILQLVGGTNITSTITSDSAGETVITFDSSALANIVEDLSPQLGGTLDVQNHTITTTTTNGSIILDADGTGVVYANNGVYSANDYASSGYGIFTGTTSTGFAALTNAGAQGASDPQFALTNGGGATLTSGAGVLSFNGASATFNGINVSNIQLKDYKESIHTISTDSAGAINIDVADGNIQEITLNENVTFTGFANPEDGQSVTLILIQDGTGSRTFTESLDSGGRMLFAGGTSTLSTTANAVDIMSILYAGGIYYASLATNFS